MWPCHSDFWNSHPQNHKRPFSVSPAGQTGLPLIGWKGRLRGRFGKAGRGEQIVSFLEALIAQRGWGLVWRWGCGGGRWDKGKPTNLTGRLEEILSVYSLMKWMQMEWAFFWSWKFYPPASRHIPSWEAAEWWTTFSAFQEDCLLANCQDSHLSFVTALRDMQAKPCPSYFSREEARHMRVGFIYSAPPSNVWEDAPLSQETNSGCSEMELVSAKQQLQQSEILN